MADPFKQGVAAYKAASYDTAVHLFSAAISANPEHAEAYHARALAYRKLGRVKDGLNDARTVVQLRPNSYKGYLEAGKLCLIGGKLEKAELLLMQAREKAPPGSATLLETITEEIETVAALRARAELRPVMQLPAEIFLDIIAMACDAHEARLLPHTSPTGLRLNPLVAALHVCKSWRSSIEATPSLWSTLHIDGEKDRSRAVSKACWWARHALGLVSGDPGGAGITGLIFTRTQTLGEHILSEVIKELQLMGALMSVRNFTISWIGGSGMASVEKHQFERAFRFLVGSCAPTLESLTLHTASHLRLGFSLPRFGNTFTALRALELRSGRPSVPAPALWLPSTLLPPYSGEEDWPAVALRRLVLVHPIWRIEFPDGTLGAPILAPSDCPLLEELVVGPTSPPMTWNLFSATGLRTLEVQHHLDIRAQPDPNLVGLAASIEHLRLVHSFALTTRLLNILVVAVLPFPALTTLELRSASLTQAHLDLFGSANAPRLVSLSLASTSSSSPIPLQLPPCDSLVLLDVSATAWLSEEFVLSLVGSAPRLERLNVDECRVPNAALVELVKRREGAIRELNLVGCAGVEETLVKWLRARIRPGGLKFSPPPSDELRPWKRTRTL